MKPDKIKIEDLEVFANHGVFPEENVLGQKFVVSAVMYTDTRRAGLTDELTASIHYGEASAFITEYLKSHTFKLLEKVAEGLAEKKLERYQDAEDECYGFINEYPDSKNKATAEKYISKCKNYIKD